MKKNDAFKAVILAGGSGERFWPLSTPERPKQFLRVFGGESLIRQSASRLALIAGPKSTYVVTAKALVPATRKELPELPKANIVGEPMRRDTGAAVALGVGLAGDGIIGFFPSDQMVGRPKAFAATVKKAIAAAKKSDAIVVIGIKPTYPSTGFGYVEPRTGRFVEKPDAKKAKTYLKKGYLWNAGMFIAKAEVFRKAFAENAPGLQILTQPNAVINRPKSTPIDLAKIYTQLEKISFDFAVMEKAKTVKVIAGDFGWDDVGSYAAFDKYFPHDSRGNVREGPCTVVESDDNICVARSARISLLGVKNLVVVTTENSVLVVDKKRLTELKKLFK